MLKMSLFTRSGLVSNGLDCEVITTQRIWVMQVIRTISEVIDVWVYALSIRLLFGGMNQ